VGVEPLQHADTRCGRWPRKIPAKARDVRLSPSARGPARGAPAPGHSHAASRLMRRRATGQTREHRCSAACQAAHPLADGGKSRPLLHHCSSSGWGSTALPNFLLASHPRTRHASARAEHYGRRLAPAAPATGDVVCAQCLGGGESRRCGPGVREDLATVRVFASDGLCNGETMVSFSASVDARQSGRK
jgi:hypothetical protein